MTTGNNFNIIQKVIFTKLLRLYLRRFNKLSYVYKLVMWFKVAIPPQSI